jgi:putative colanic acid biosynthesis acetyltransferase WcaF
MKELRYQSEWSLRQQAMRALWQLSWLLLCRWTPPLPGLWAWRRLVLRAFGAKVGVGAKINASVTVWAPWNLDIGDYALVGPRADLYSVDKITLGTGAWVSQYAHLCAAAHDLGPGRALVHAPITLGPGAWVAAGAFVGPGVSIGAGAVLGARGAAFKDVPARWVVGGVPAKRLRRLGEGPGMPARRKR